MTRSKMASFLSAFLILTCVLNAQVLEPQIEPNDPNKIAKQHRLEVTNDTNREDDASARELYLVWTNDVDKPPRYTERLSPGQMDWFPSKGVGRGHNFRRFIITVYRWKEGDKQKIGNFTHSIYASPGEHAHTEATSIFKNITQDEVELWREYYIYHPNNEGPVRQLEFIGAISKDEW